MILSWEQIRELEKWADGELDMIPFQVGLGDMLDTMLFKDMGKNSTMTKICNHMIGWYPTAVREKE